MAIAHIAPAGPSFIVLDVEVREVQVEIFERELVVFILKFLGRVHRLTGIRSRTILSGRTTRSRFTFLTRCRGLIKPLDDGRHNSVYLSGGFIAISYLTVAVLVVVVSVSRLISRTAIVVVEPSSLSWNAVLIGRLIFL